MCLWLRNCCVCIETTVRVWVCEREIESVCFEQTLMSEKTMHVIKIVCVCASVFECVCVRVCRAYGLYVSIVGKQWVSVCVWLVASGSDLLSHLLCHS